MSDNYFEGLDAGNSNRIKIKGFKCRTCGSTAYYVAGPEVLCLICETVNGYIASGKDYFQFLGEDNDIADFRWRGRVGSDGKIRKSLFDRVIARIVGWN